ncbi:MAG: VanZ family protein [Pseudomonadota bacterium]
MRNDSADGKNACLMMPLSPARRSLPYELAALGLVLLYVNTFEVWQALSAGLGGRVAAVVPVALVAAVVAAAGLAVPLWRQRGGQVAVGTLLVGLGVAAAALWVSDPAYPAKRIHVFEYMLLSVVVRKALAFHLNGRALLFATAALTGVLGSHDELIQGLHPNRVYGLRDIAINTLGGLAGALVGYAFALFERPHAAPAASPPAGLEPAAVVAAGGLALGWALLLFALPSFRGGALPWWTAVPLVAGGCAWAVVGHRMAHAPGPHHVWTRGAGLTLATAMYPVLAYALALDFN